MKFFYYILDKDIIKWSYGVINGVSWLISIAQLIWNIIKYSINVTCKGVLEAYSHGPHVYISDSFFFFYINNLIFLMAVFFFFFF